MFQTDEGTPLIVPSVNGVIEKDDVPQARPHVCDCSVGFASLGGEATCHRIIRSLAVQLFEADLGSHVYPKRDASKRDHAIRDSNAGQPDATR